MGVTWTGVRESATADLRLYRPRHARPPRPVVRARGLRARAGRRLAIAAMYLAEAGAQLQMRAGAPHGRAWA